MDSLPAEVQDAIKRAGVITAGVACPNPADKSTWRVDHLPSATEADKAMAASVIASFALGDPVVVEAAKDREAAVIDGNLAIQAVAQLDFEERQKLTVRNGFTLLTAAQCKARVKAIYKSLLP